jgi:hypothetical protein
MEVHHHPHIPNHKKQWKEYLLEGFMIFIAVTMGFFAEQVREHMIEKNREKAYMESMIHDLEKDREQLDRLIKTYETAYINSADTIFVLMENFDVQKPANDLYYHLRLTNRFLTIKGYISNRTISQLNNTGNLRLVENREVEEAILDYYSKINVVRELEEYLYKEKHELREMLPSLLKGEMYDKIIDDKDHLVRPSTPLYANPISVIDKSTLLYKMSDIKGLSRNIYLKLQNILKQSEQLKKQIESSYHL